MYAEKIGGQGSMKKTLLTIMVIAAMAALTACGGSKPTPTAEAVTPSETATPTGEATPSVTETPSPVPTEEPTPEPTPELRRPDGFPEDVALERAPKYTEAELKKLIEETALATERYLYKETYTYAEARTDWEYSFGFEVKFNKKVVYFDSDMRDESVETTWPDAVTYYMNDREVASVYHNVYGEMAVHDGKKELSIDYEEKDENGNILYRQNGERFMEANTAQFYSYDAQGRLVSIASYNFDGYLNGLWITSYNENGDLLAEYRFAGNNGSAKSTAYEVTSKDVRTYNADGNCVSGEYKMEATNKTYTSVYEKDGQGRVKSEKKTILPDAVNEITENLYFYNADGSVLIVMVWDTNYSGRLFYPSEENKKRIENGLTPVYDEKKDRELKYGSMNKEADGKYTFAIVYDEHTYNKDGLMTYDGYFEGDSRTTYFEYNAKKQLTRKYGKDGIEGNFEYRYSYDAKGNVITETLSSDMLYEDGNYLSGEDGKKSWVSTTNYTYDGKGTRIGIKRKTTVKGKVRSEGEWKYDEKGVPVSAKVTEYLDGKVYVKIVGERMQ